MDIGKKIVAIDFDGTLIEGGNYPDLGEPIKNSIEAVKVLMNDKDVLLVLWSCRDKESDPKAYYNMLKFCTENGLKFDAINDNVKEYKEFGVKCRKIIADLYIDDNTFLKFSTNGMSEYWDLLKTRYKEILGINGFKERTMNATVHLDT